MQNSAVKLSKVTRTEDRPVVKPQQKVQQVEKSAVPQNNTFYKIMSDESVSLEERQKQVAEALVFTGDKQASREKIREITEFREYMESVRENLNTELISVSDTDTFVMLQKALNDCNQNLSTFEDIIKPLVETVNSLTTLRTENVTYDVFREIQKDKEFEEEIKKQKDQFTSDINDIDRQITMLKIDTKVQQGNTNWFGSLKKSATLKIAENDTQMTTLQKRRYELVSQISNLNNKKREADANFAKYSEEKLKLRELLDLTSDVHKEKQQQLIKAALDYVHSHKSTSQQLKVQCGKLVNQTTRLFDATQKVNKINSVLGEGIKEAEQKNQQLRPQYEPPAEEENLVDQHEREEKRIALDQHLGSLIDAQSDVARTSAQLASQLFTVKTMQDTVNRQHRNVQVMGSTGSAHVAEQLATTITAFGSAALNEAAGATQHTMQRMREMTNKITQGQAFSNAASITEEGQELLKALEEVSNLGNSINEEISKVREGMSVVRGALDDAVNLTRDVSSKVADSIAAKVDGAVESQTQTNTSKVTNSQDMFSI